MTPDCVNCRAHDHDALPGAASRNRRCRLLSSYLLSLQMGENWVREMILWDICCLRDLGALRQVTDLEAALDCFLSCYPEARALQRSYEAGGAFAAKPT